MAIAKREKPVLAGSDMRKFFEREQQNDEKRKSKIQAIENEAKKYSLWIKQN